MESNNVSPLEAEMGCFLAHFGGSYRHKDKYMQKAMRNTFLYMSRLAISGEITKLFPEIGATSEQTTGEHYEKQSQCR